MGFLETIDATGGNYQRGLGNAAIGKRRGESKGSGRIEKPPKGGGQRSIPGPPESIGVSFPDRAQSDFVGLTLGQRPWSRGKLRPLERPL